MESVENPVETGEFSTFDLWKEWKVLWIQRFVEERLKIWYNSLTPKRKHTRSQGYNKKTNRNGSFSTAFQKGEKQYEQLA